MKALSRWQGDELMSLYRPTAAQSKIRAAVCIGFAFEFQHGFPPIAGFIWGGQQMN
jgi:hypothetical protein